MKAFESHMRELRHLVAQARFCAHRKKRSQHNPTYHSYTLMMREENHRFLASHFSPGPPEHKAGVLPTQQWHWVSQVKILYHRIKNIGNNTPKCTWTEFPHPQTLKIQRKRHFKNPRLMERS